MPATHEHERRAADEAGVNRGFERHIIADLTRSGSRMSRLRMSAARVEQFLTVADAAQWVGCCEETIRRAYLARQLDVLRFGTRRVRIRPSALVAWLERGGKTTAA
jgi:excisionase family DNA binding protein